MFATNLLYMPYVNANMLTNFVELGKAAFKF